MGRLELVLAGLITIAVVASALPASPGAPVAATAAAAPAPGPWGLPAQALAADAAPLSHLRATHARLAQDLEQAAQAQDDPALGALAAARILVQAQADSLAALVAADPITRWEGDHPNLDLAQRLIQEDTARAPPRADPTLVPSAAAMALAERVGAPLDAGTREKLASLDATPEPARTALAHVLTAFVGLDVAAARVFPGTHREALAQIMQDWREDPLAFPHGPTQAPARDLEAARNLFAARETFIDAALGLQAALAVSPASAAQGACAAVVVPPAFAIDLTNCDNTYVDDVVLLIDAQGDDKYYNNAGGNNLVANDCGLIGLRATTALLDFAGNDAYGDPANPRSCGANGGSIDGVGMILDAMGDDTYTSGEWATNGGTFFAVGLILDLAGNDAYVAGRAATNGGAVGWLKTTGIQAQAAIIDLMGADRYVAEDVGTNGGAVGGGMGFLFDAEGSDVYEATNLCTNGGSLGDLQLFLFGMPTIGLVVDATGDDRYRAGLGATNGGGYLIGAGGLLDVQGSDAYEALDAATNGGGFFAGHGFLVDLSGADTYRAGGYATNGGGLFAGGGFLFDALGNDKYLSGGSGANGGAYLGASGFLLDAQGNDLYGPHRPWLSAASQTGAALAARHLDRLPAERISGLASLGTTDRATLIALLRDPYLAGGGVQVEPVARDAPRFVVGLADVAGLAPGDTWNHGQVLRVNPTLRYAVVESGDPVRFEASALLARGVRYVERDRVAWHANVAPDDPRWGEQYGPTRLRVPDAWNFTMGDASATVCVADSGLRYTHEDIAAARYLGGYDFVNDDADPWDDHGHGTHVAGIAAATTHNGKGIAGVAQAGLLVAKVLSAGGWGSWEGVAAGIQWCADQGAKVVSLSLGGGHANVLREAVQHAWDAGALLVAAAGNSGPCVDCVIFPARYEEVVAVVCTDATDARCSFSSTGPEAEVAAPGLGILSLGHFSDNAYRSLSGTSMSTPHVSGVAALAWSLNPGLTNCEVRQLLRDHARDLGSPGRDPEYGLGLVDAHAVVVAVAAGNVPTDCPPLALSSGSWAGVNGGAMLAAAGTLLDLVGDDTYAAGSYGVNGGGYLAGSGRLVDLQGNDKYLAGRNAVNGGASGECYLVLVDVPCVDLTTASGLLLDLSGRDAYEDEDSGATADATVVPKGTYGAQVDVGAGLV